MQCTLLTDVVFMEVASDPCLVVAALHDLSDIFSHQKQLPVKKVENKKVGPPKPAKGNSDLRAMIQAARQKAKQEKSSANGTPKVMLGTLCDGKYHGLILAFFSLLMGFLQTDFFIDQQMTQNVFFLLFCIISLKH